MENPIDRFCDEPTLAEVLSDPVTSAVIAADRIDPADLSETLTGSPARSRQGAAWPSAKLTGSEHDCQCDPGVRDLDAQSDCRQRVGVGTRTC